MKKWIKRLLIIIVCFGIIGMLAIQIIDGYVINQVKDNIIDIEVAKEKNVDCILVLGAGLRSDGTPSLMLRDRLDKGIELYHQNISTKLLMSGDHGRTQYDEVNAMKDYAISKGVPSKDIFMDHAGFSTYDSMYRAKEVFQVSSSVIVTQEYHMYRALYIANEMDIESYGIAAKDINYSGQNYREMREKLARVKDFIYTKAKPKPIYLGEAIPITGDGNMTNDRE